ncbi:MAG: gamma-glutamyltransferase [Oligoflexales bacterium]
MSHKDKGLLCILLLLPAFAAAGKEVVAKNTMIVSQGENASKAGLEIAKKGGNIIDIATAVTFAISVESPQSTGLGGGGFMLFRLPNSSEIVAVDFREQAPLKAHRDMYLDAKGEIVPKLSLDGALSVGVPGLVAGIVEIHKKHGKLPLKDVMAPAIRLAENGIKVYHDLAVAFADRQDVLRRFPASAKIFLDKDGQPLREGNILVQKDLTQTLRVIAAKGRDGFYKGSVAKAIVAANKTYNGFITQQDLDQYKVAYRTPVQGTYGEYKIYSMPPPSSGGTHVIEMLNILEKFNLKKLGPYSPQAVHLTASAMQLAFFDRAKYMGDPDFVEVPVKGLTSKAYADEIRGKISPIHATRSEDMRGANPKSYEQSHTTHFTIVDKSGAFVASTQTINGWMGSGVTVEGTGIVLNNEMDDFSAKPGIPNMFGAVGGKENEIAPRKRPLSSMSPTVAERPGKNLLVLGSPSGTRIITCVMLTLLNRIEYDLPLDQAVGNVRYHHQWLPDELRVEMPYFEPALEAQLVKMGHKINKQEIGCKVGTAELQRNEGIIKGVADPRGEGLAIGN